MNATHQNALPEMVSLAPNAGALVRIDTHAHVFAQGLPLAAVRRHAPDYDATLSAYMSLLELHGITHGVLVQPSFLGTDNRFLLAALKCMPHRLRGVVVLDPVGATVDLRALDRFGVRGIRLNLVGLPIPDLRGGPWRLLLGRLRELDWHVEVHCEAPDLPGVMEPLLEASCKTVVDHFGRPTRGGDLNDPGFQWLLGTADTGRVWVKLAAAYRSWPAQDGPDACAAAQVLLRYFGADRLLWGSDWPHTQHRDVARFTSTKDALNQWIPDEPARAGILGETAAALYRFF
ncbi:MAG: amidohydrolase family protein [Burkholderiaceae bacterium]